VGPPPIHCQPAQSSLVAHPSDVPIEFILNVKSHPIATPFRAQY
jgi:hypothetical protein